MMFPPPPEDEIIRILGIDPGTDTVGFCIMDVHCETYETRIVWMHTFHAAKSYQEYTGLEDFRGHRDPQLKAISDFLMKVLIATEPLLIGAESPFFQYGRVSAFEALVEVYAMLRETVWRYSPALLLRRIDPFTAKAAVGASHTAVDKKKAVRDGVEKHFNDKCLPGVVFDEQEEHAIDAVSVANAVRRMCLFNEVLREIKKKKGKKKFKKK